MGRYLVDHLSNGGHDVFPVFRNCSILKKNARYCDLRNYDLTCKMVSNLQPDALVHCAATSIIEDCEKNKFDAWQTNVDSTLHLLKGMNRDCHFIYLSSAEVFDGADGSYAEGSVPNPIHWYGCTKLASEFLTRGLAEIHTIIRLSYQYGFDSKTRNFVHQSVLKLASNQTVSANEDLISSPTHISTTVSALSEIIENRMTGFFNVADIQPMSKYQLIFNIAQYLHKPFLVRKETSNNMFLIKRPKNTSLCISKFLKSFKKSKPMSQREALARILDDYK